MKTDRVDHYGATYREFAARVYAEVRAQTFGEDNGQNGWLTADEQDRFISWLELDRDRRLLDIACGSGGPSLRMARVTQCNVLGIDLHEDAIRTARAQAEQAGLATQATFQQVDASKLLPFPDHAFDAVLCVDAINHLPDRALTFREWRRVLKPQGRLVFTDPIVVTGPLTNEEMNIRSSIGFFLFVPPELDQTLFAGGGFRSDREGRSHGEHGPHRQPLAGGARSPRRGAAQDRGRDIRGPTAFLRRRPEAGRLSPSVALRVLLPTRAMTRTPAGTRLGRIIP